MNLFPAACFALLPALLPTGALGLALHATADADAEAAAGRKGAAAAGSGNDGGAGGFWFRARRGRRGGGSDGLLSEESEEGVGERRGRRARGESAALAPPPADSTLIESESPSTSAPAPPPAEQPLSAAYCVHGLVRGFTNPLVWKSILEKVVEPAKGSTDLFFYLKYSTGEERTAAEAAAREMNATRVQMLPAGDAAVNGSCHGGRAADFDAVFTDLEHCFALIEEEEARRGRLYDFVGKLRADEELCTAFPALEEMGRRAVMVWDMPGVVDGGEVSDHVAVMPRSLAPHYFHAVKELQDCHPREDYDTFCLVRPAGARRHKDEGVSPECFLGQALAREAVVVDLKTLGEGRYCIWHDATAPAKCKLGGVFAQLYRADYTPTSCKG